MKESFVFYHEWAEAIKDLPDEDRLEIYEAIVAYSETGEEPDLYGAAKLAFKFIKPQIDRNSEKYEKRAERSRENGKRGGRPKNPENPVGFLGFHEKPRKPDNVNVNDNENVNVNDNDNVNENVNVNGSGGGNDNVQAPPTTDLAPEDIFSYFEEIGSKADPQRFIDYYGLEALSNMNWRKVADQWKQTQFTRKPKSDTLYEELMKWAKE
jgi:hypothetical protein